MAPPKPAVKPAKKAPGVQKKVVKKAAATDGPQFDPEERYQGTVKGYNKQSGYGFIRLDQSGVIDGDEVFVFWKSIESTDRFPFLHKDLEVEFGLRRQKNGQVNATRVCLPGGASITLQDENDSNFKSFLTGQDDRYSGKLKFYNPQKGFGYITVTDTIEQLNGNTEIRVERQEVNAGGKQPEWMKDLDVEFGIWVTKGGDPKAYNMTGVGGMALTREFLENRTAVKGGRVSGEITMWNWRKGYGYIKPTGKVSPAIQTAMKKMLASAAEKAKKKGKEAPTEALIYVRRSDVPPGSKLETGTKVTFELYTDDQGCGATNVTLS